MARVTTEVAARSNMRQGLARAKEDVKAFRNSVREQMRSLRSDMKQDAQKGGGLFGAVLKGNLAAKGLEMAGRAASQAAANVGELVDASEQLGVSAETIGKLERVMEGSGVKAENLRKAFMGLNEQQSQVKNGSEEAAAKFAQLGISAEEVTSLGLEDLFFRVSDGLAAMSDQGKAAAAATDLIGNKNARMIAKMREGSEAIRDDMANVSGAISDANAKAVDDTADALQSGWSAVKGFFGNAAGAAVRAAQATKKAFDDAMSGPSFGPSGPAQAAADKNAEKTKAEGQQRVLAAHAQLRAGKEQEDQSKRILKASERITEAEQEAEQAAFEQLTLAQKRAYWEKKMAEARAEEKKAGNEAERHEAVAKKAEIQNNLDDVKRRTVEEEMLDPETKSRTRAESRRQDRRRRWAQNVVASKERDAIDRQLRNGKITPAEAEQMRKDLRADKPEDRVKTPEEQILSDIKSTLEKMGAKLGVARA